MNLAQLKLSIVENKLDKTYIFTGDEIKVMNLYIEQIAKVENKTICRKDTVGEIFKQLKITKLTNESNVYVILDDMDFLKQTEKEWEQVIQGTDKHTIILIYSNLDKRGKFYKQYKDSICEFEKLHENILAKYIQKEVDLSTANATHLALMCENSYNRILMEVDKLQHLQQVYNLTADNAYLKMLNENLIHTVKSEFVFSLVDAICKRQVYEALELLKDLDVTKDSPIAILSLLYTNIKSMLLVRACPSGNKMSETTGLTGWQIKMAMEKGNKYSMPELLNIMQVIKYTDEAIKIGRIEPQHALPFVVCKVM